MQTAPSNIKFSYFFLVSLDKVKVDEKFHNKPKGNFKRIKWKKNYETKQNYETKRNYEFKSIEHAQNDNDF